MRVIADSKAAYIRFLTAIKEKECVWFLLDVQKDYPAHCLSNDSDRIVFPFWSAEAYAKRCRTHFVFETKVDKIPIVDFLNHTLPHIENIGALIGPDWNRELAGSETSPEQFISDLSAV